MPVIIISQEETWSQISAIYKNPRQHLVMEVTRNSGGDSLIFSIQYSFRNINFASIHKAHIFLLFFLWVAVKVSFLQRLSTGLWLVKQLLYIPLPLKHHYVLSYNFTMIKVLTRQQKKVTNRMYTSNSSCAGKIHSVIYISFQNSLSKNNHHKSYSVHFVRKKDKIHTQKKRQNKWFSISVTK